MMTNFSLGIVAILGWTLIETYYRPYSWAPKRWARLSWLPPGALYIVWAGVLALAQWQAGLVFALLGGLLTWGRRRAWQPVSLTALAGVGLVALSGLAYWAGWRWPWQPAWFWTILYTAWLGAPVNQLFHFLFRRFQPENTVDDATIEGAGATIGILERLIMGLLLVNQNYAALGLVFTAKSIARYDKISKNSAFAEYYLIGSLFSLLAVLVLYQVYQWGWGC